MADVVKLAVLIDADNAKSENVEPLLAEIAKYGVASVKRAYGNWTTPILAGWKQVLVEQSIQPMQQFNYTVGKNSTDSALIIDAMDLLYTGRFGGFCLISSDSDFTRLAQRIREAGLLVYGFGERKTPTSLVSACDKFVYMDLLREAPPASSNNSSGNEPRPKRGEQRPDPKLLQIFKAAVDAASDDEGWANLGAIGNHVSKRAPDFDPRNYGYKKLSELLRAVNLFDWEERKTADGKSKAMLLRHRAGASTQASSAPAAVPAATPTVATQVLAAAAVTLPARPAAAPTPALAPAPVQAQPPRPPQTPRVPQETPEDRPFMPGLLSPQPLLPAAAPVPAPQAQKPAFTPPIESPAASALPKPQPLPTVWALPSNPPARQQPKQQAAPAAVPALPPIPVATVTAAPQQPKQQPKPEPKPEPKPAPVVEAPAAPVAAAPAPAVAPAPAAPRPAPGSKRPAAPATRSEKPPKAEKPAKPVAKPAKPKAEPVAKKPKAAKPTKPTP